MYPTVSGYGLPPPPYPYEGFFARLACLQGHGETNEARRNIAYPEQLRRLKLAEYLNQTPVYSKYCLLLSRYARVCVLMRDYLNNQALYNSI